MLPVKLERIGKPNIFPTPLPIINLIRILKCKVLANSITKCKSHKSLHYTDMGGEYYNIIYEVNLLNTKELNKINEPFLPDLNDEQFVKFKQVFKLCNCTSSN